MIPKLKGRMVVGCRIFKTDCHTRDLGRWLGCPPSMSFYMILARTYASFGENHGKLRMNRSTNATGD